jgi:hypothetical protein
MLCGLINQLCFSLIQLQRQRRIFNVRRETEKALAA